VYEDYRSKHPLLYTIGKYYEVVAVLNCPRICLRADTVAPFVDHVTFNTTDLTGHCFGCDQQDAEKYFPLYIYDKIYLVSINLISFWYLIIILLLLLLIFILLLLLFLPSRHSQIKIATTMNIIIIIINTLHSNT